MTFLDKKLTSIALAEARGGGSRDELPELAVAPSYYPAWVPYSFYGDDGTEKRRLKIDEDTLELMKELAKGHIDIERLEGTELSTFLQLAFSTEGELVLMSRE